MSIKKSVSVSVDVLVDALLSHLSLMSVSERRYMRGNDEPKKCILHLN